MAQRETPPPKKDVARALLLRGSVFVYLDPRRDDVAVPVWLAKQPQLVLQVGLDLPVPIPDLRVDDAGVFGTLSFNRAPFTCAVPWDAVFALWGDDGMGMVWPEDMPPEIAAEVEEAARREAGPRPRARRMRTPRPETSRPTRPSRARTVSAGSRPTCGSSSRPRPWTAPARNERGRFIPARDRTASPALRRLLASRCRAGTLARDWQWRMEDGGLLGGPPHATASRRRYSTRARALSTRAARRRLEPVLLHLVDEGSP